MTKYNDCSCAWARRNRRSIRFRLEFSLLLSLFQDKESKVVKEYSNKFYALSFACAKESAKEKHTGNDLQPLPDALIRPR